MTTNDDREDIIRDGRSLRTNPAEVGYRWRSEATAGAADADAQLSAARGAAYAWLRTTLAALPAAVTSLSVGCVLEDHDDRPNLAPRLRAEVVTPEVTLRYPEDYPDDDLECIDALDDGLADMTRPFLFALGDEEYLTVTRADLAVTFNTAGIDPALSLQRDPTPRRWIASKNRMNPDGSISTTTYSNAPEEDVIHGAFAEAVAATKRGETMTATVRRDASGALTITVTR